MREIRQITEAYQQAQHQQKKAVLATVVHIEGSAYRAPGARMLIEEDGRTTGAVSGGCLEGDILRRALLVMQKQQPALVTYDTTEDDDAAGIGVSLGCNGIIRILLEPLAAGTHHPVALLQQAVSSRTPAVIATFFTPDNSRDTQQGTRLLVNHQQQPFTGSPLPVGLPRLLPDVAQVFAMQASAFISYTPAHGGSYPCQVFLEYLHPAPALVIAGAGNDILPVVQMAHTLGWDTTLVDGRPAYASKARFPLCRIHIAAVTNPLGSVTPDAYTAILLMSHNYAYDKAALKQALQSQVPYIGILGPAKKRERMLQELKEEGITITAAQEQRIYGPTGLDIGAETPEEIALSILSEIKTVFAQTKGALLRSRKGSIHKRHTRISNPLETYGILVLAAGQSKRLGFPKQQLMYKGDTLLRNALRTACTLGVAATAVTTGNNAAEVKKQLQDMPVTVLENPAYAEGMASSIRTGVAWLTQQHPQLQHILIMLCDQPYLTAQHLRNLIHRQQQTGARVTASYYAERQGVPALFHQSLFTDLLQLQGDKGARYLIEALANEVEQVACPALATDVDDSKAWWKLIEEEEKTSPIT
ncbi:xanthine/CO dehydrogenase XdhC/CoxF family maturation factor/CTP:molybdopterin cytidylyltransferase MocA [Filimonas zeae]|uniref:CTP:molybdopterin cytidylyltransferase MocA n=1 Tax=Filimonas zeae TaxID=1737353 RepID=A0A917IWT4_9BACT|nr:XdhC family protein [Filimonas zeae]MDR6339111.1 xanthine/CO dehydrogenase XdhC/CoxF family maturation factor/CTP:molybdopterin cytidylyltransferase MocA [Filimonas zeae]GGH65063.1 hypothetical protein GCM10011379_17800 [Filimonas zeae]